MTSSNSGVPDISGSVYNKTQVTNVSCTPTLLCCCAVCAFTNKSSLLYLQSFDKQGFHAGTPPPFTLPSALGGPGPLNPGAAPGGYAPAPFLHILPHQQPHSQLLHHHLAQDGQVQILPSSLLDFIFVTSYMFICFGMFTCLFMFDVQGGPSQRGQSSSLQQKSQVNKSGYGSSPYWAN